MDILYIKKGQHSEWVSKESIWSILEILKQSQQQQQAPKTKEKLIMVSPPPGFNNFIANQLHQDVQNFQGDNLRYFSKNWYKYTKDKYILDIVTNGLKLELNELPCQYSKSNYPLSTKEKEVISTEIKKLLKKKVIVRSITEYNESISGIFTRNKKDGSKRMRLDLKKFNKFVN